jgi:hypothetical protein
MEHGSEPQQEGHPDFKSSQSIVCCSDPHVSALIRGKFVCSFGAREILTLTPDPRLLLLPNFV